MITVEIDYEALADKLASRLEPQGSPWMTVTEAAEYLRASESWLRARLYKIPHCKVDGKTLLNRRELDVWVMNRGTEASSAR